jgi:hypothetical protein
MNLLTAIFPPRHRRRWSDNERNLGPFTYSHDRSSNLELMIDSGDEESPGASLRLRALGHTLILWLPSWALRPHREKVIAETWDAATVTRLGRNWYWDTTKRAFGFYVFEWHHFVVKYGAQTDNSKTDKSWGCFLPFNDWRHVRRSLYDLSGKHFWSEGEKHARWEVTDAVKAACPKAVFEFDDFDGERIQASTMIEEREWRFGTKWCRWLSMFRRPRVSRALSIEFSKEVGTEKDSWKGGTLGHGIEMLPGELHEAAFRRYCEQGQRGRNGRTFRITFVGRVETEKPIGEQHAVAAT